MIQNQSTSDPSVLVAGHSHIGCLGRAYAERDFEAETKFINLRKFNDHENDTVGSAIKDELGAFVPDVICLNVGGNLHNFLGIFEHPVPFSVGHSASGALPTDVPERAFIPHALLAEFFHQDIRRDVVASIYDAFPKAKRLFMNTPPPISDFDHIRKYPGVFHDKIHLGPPPTDLKMYLYEIQSGSFRDLAREFDAEFVEVDNSLKTKDGFLAPEYFQEDPTHGNIDYGAVMLSRVLDRAKGSS